MFALTIEWLMGRAITTSWNDREEPEWPPHPDRVFMALVAGFGETGEEPAEKAALEWLEQQGPPSLLLPRLLSIRTPCTTYVPVNDDSSQIGKKGPLGMLGTAPIGRNRQPRFFPSVVPSETCFHLCWNVDIPPELRDPLATLCTKVTYLGHSGTPVRMGIAETMIEPNYIPTHGASEHRLRIFGPGRLEYLKNRHEAGLRPQPAIWQGYSAPRTKPMSKHPQPFDSAIIVLKQINSKKWPLESAPNLIDALRSAFMKRFDPDIPEWISGHQPDGQQSKRNRPAAFPLAFVGRPHADGRLFGIGIAIPCDFKPEQVAAIYHVLQSHGEIADEYDISAGQGFVHLKLRHQQSDHHVGDCVLQLDESSDRERKYSLQTETWIRQSTTWATVTPLMLPQYPKANLVEEEIIANACEQAGYPRPIQVDFGKSPFLTGVPSVRSFADRNWPANRPRRPLYHARLIFEQAITGPVLIGAGRYNGFGTCRPS